MFNSDLRECPECHSDWRSSEIPRDSLAKGYYGHNAPCEKKREWDDDYDETVPCTCPVRWFSRLCGVETGSYDGVSLWVCPDCHARWDRWSGKLLDNRGGDMLRSEYGTQRQQQMDSEVCHLQDDSWESLEQAS